jgi:hypothetical protein
MDDLDKIESIIRHLENVQRNCILLGKRLIEQGKFELGRLLIANGFIHDNSKFYGIEWSELSPSNADKGKLSLAVQHHNHTNSHHPEYWGNIKNMPEIYLIEMVCDWKARSTEFGSSVMEWVDEQATKRYCFTKEDKVYADIVKYLSLLCDQPFKPITS